MKLNFKKIVPVLTGAILLGSTIAFAAMAGAVDTASYPSSYSDAVVVIGAASADSVAANEIAMDLGKISTLTNVANTTVTGISGENVKIESSSNSLNIGNQLDDVHPTTLDHGDLPVLLKKGTFQAAGESYDYEQEIKIADGMTFTNVKDEDLSDNPVLGVALTSGQAVVNYTLSFTKDAESDIEDTNHMVDFEDTEIEILGKSYTILNAYNSTNIKLELMGGSVNDILDEGAKKDYVVNGKSYSVEISYVGEDSVKLIVNGESTSSLEEGESYTLNDETELGIRDIMYTPKTGSMSKVEFTLGAEQLVLENGQEVEMGGDTVDGLKCFITGGADYISEIKLEWKTDEEAFISNKAALELPGLKSFKIQAGDLTTALKEDITIKNNGDEIISLTFPFETGTKTFDLLYGNGTAFQGLGKNAQHSIVAGSNSITFNESANDYFVATFVDGTAAESYLLEARVSEDSGIDYASIRDVVTGDYFCEDKKATQTCKVGSVVLTLGTIDDDAHTVAISSSANTFNRLVSKEGLQLSLPSDVTNSTALLTFTEENKDETIAGGNSFNATLGWNSGKVEVTSTTPSILDYELSDTDKYEAYIASDLGTKLTFDKDPDQNTLEIEYHGEEVTGNVWIAASDAVTTSASGFVNALVVKDTELTATQKAGNMVVVGGPAINSIAAELLGLAFPTYGDSTVSGFSPNMAQITLFEGKLSPGSVALLVAGYDSKDTLTASRALVADGKVGTVNTTTSAYSYVV